jgi:hypothetical protein
MSFLHLASRFNGGYYLRLKAEHTRVRHLHPPPPHPHSIVRVIALPGKNVTILKGTCSQRRKKFCNNDTSTKEEGKDLVIGNKISFVCKELTFVIFVTSKNNFAASVSNPGAVCVF